MTNSDFSLMAAPIQGHTDAAYRAFHAQVYGDADAYFTPFIRAEKGAPRNRDLNDAFGPLNDGHRTVPQVIFRDAQIQDGPYDLIDLNMGCPFPLQTARGRGAAAICSRELVSAIAETISEYTDIKFSLKMRLGMVSPDEWKTAFDLINKMPLEHLTVHPRFAKLPTYL